MTETNLLLSSTLQEERTKGSVIVSFAADRTKMDKITLKVVVRHSERSRTGHVIPMKDFVDLEKIR